MTTRELPERAWLHVSPSGAMHYDPRPSAVVGAPMVEYVRADKYDRLRAELAAAQDTVKSFSIANSALIARATAAETALAHAREEREAVARDAERWRYTRDLLEIRNQKAMDGQRHAFLSLRIAAGRKFDWEIPEGTYYVRGNALDAEIDRALAARAGEEGR